MVILILIFYYLVMVVENYVMVDVFLGGWLLLGVGFGYFKYEFEGYDVDFVIKCECFDEVLMFVECLFVGECVYYVGQFYMLCDVCFNVLFVQVCVLIYVVILWCEVVYYIGW